MSKFETKIVGKLNRYERNFVLNRYVDFVTLIGNNKKLLNVFLELIESDQVLIDGSPKEAAHVRDDVMSVRRFLQDIQKNPELHILERINYGDTFYACPDAIGYCEENKTLTIWDLTFYNDGQNGQSDIYATYAALYCVTHNICVDDVKVLAYEYISGVRYPVEVQNHHVVRAMIGINNFCHTIQEVCE